MLRVGLTGSIATGKTTVLGAIAALGIPVHSADQAVHALYGGKAVPLIAAHFPAAIVDDAVDRARLAEILGRDREKLSTLEALIHPLVRKDAQDFLERAAADGADMAVIEVPLLFEAGFDYGLDTIIVTACAPDIQRARAMARPGMTGEKFDFLLSRQLDQDEKKRRADIVIDTSGTIEETIARTGAAIAKLRSGRVR